MSDNHFPVLLQNLKQETAAAYFRSGRFNYVSYEAGEVIHAAGEACECLELILDGEVRSSRDPSGGEALRGRGGLIGGQTLFAGEPIYRETFTAESELCLIQMDKDALFEAFLDQPEFLLAYLEILSDLASGAALKQTFVQIDLRQKIMCFLNREAKKAGSSSFVLNMSKKSMAAQLGIKQTALYRELAGLKNEGLIDYDEENIMLSPEYVSA